MTFLKVHSVSNYIIIFVSVCAFIIVVRVCVLWPIQDSLVDQPQAEGTLPSRPATGTLLSKIKIKKMFSVSI